MLKRFIQKILLKLLFTPEHQFYIIRAMDLRADALRSLRDKKESEYLERTLHDLRAKIGDEIMQDIAMYESLIAAIKTFTPDAGNTSK